MTPDCPTLVLCLQKRLQKHTCPDAYLRVVHPIRTGEEADPWESQDTEAASLVGPVFLGQVAASSIGCFSVNCLLGCCKKPGRAWA